MLRIKLLFVALFLLVFITFPKPSLAQSDYVLPYPSFMPGSKFYILTELIDKSSKYWYFGDFASFKYNLSQSDKYLVQAKTLFEYQQYLLGSESLKKSNFYYLEAKKTLKEADKKKSTREKKGIFISASEKHREVLQDLLDELPETFEWNPEKGEKTLIYLWNDINKSIALRK